MAPAPPKVEYRNVVGLVRVNELAKQNWKVVSAHLAYENPFSGPIWFALMERPIPPEIQRLDP